MVKNNSKKAVTWILLADGKQANVYIRQYKEKQIPLPGNAAHHHYSESQGYELIPVMGMDTFAESRADYEIGRNKGGMVFESVGTKRHMGEPHENINDAIKHHLIGNIVKRLNVAWKQKMFDRLVLIAPARILAELKQHLDQNILKHVVAELPKNLTQCQNEELAAHLKNIV